jgi:hypothetical protein
MSTIQDLSKTFDLYSKFESLDRDVFEIHGAGGGALFSDPQMFIETSQANLENRLSEIEGAYPKDPNSLISRAWQAYRSRVGTKAAIHQLHGERSSIRDQLQFLHQSFANSYSQEIDEDEPVTFSSQSNPSAVDDFCEVNLDPIERNLTGRIEEYRQILETSEKKTLTKVWRVTCKVVRYVLAQSLLVILVPCVWILDLFSKIKGHFSTNSPEKHVKKGLKAFVQEEDNEKIIAHFQKTLDRLHPQKSQATKSLLIEFLAMKELHQDLHHVLKGANVVFLDGGRLFHSWKNWEGIYDRISSHNHEPGNCRGIKSKLFKEVLFWLDRDGNTRLQLEKSTVFGLGNKLRHLVDFLRYFRDGLQQGPYGVSDKVERSPLVVAFDFDAFEKNKKAVS